MSRTATRTRWAWVCGTFFGIGSLGKGGGTWAALVTVGLWWLACRGLEWGTATAATITAALIATVGGVAVAQVLIRETGKKDPSEVVLDEVAGQLIALIGAPAPYDWKYLLASLILFRVFDILKPPPVHQLEHLRGGWGVMMDDVAAGGLAWLVVQALHLGRVV
jgi:phosphatidylglycerophosphatase A